MITNTLKLILIIPLILTLFSCKPFSKDSLSSICESDPELCTDIHKLSDCRYQRTFLIRARYYNKIEPNAKHTRVLFERISNYKACLEMTLSMEFTRNLERKTVRIENYQQIQKLLNEELNKIKGTQDPALAYYLWTNHQDLRAKKVFLKAAFNDQLQSVDLISKLAIYYNKYDQQRALMLFYKALSQSHNISDISADIYINIMTIYYQNQNFEQAYIWALIAQEQSQDEDLSIDFDLILQKGLINGEKLIVNEQALQETAELYIQQLTNNNFAVEAPQLHEEEQEEKEENKQS